MFKKDIQPSTKAKLKSSAQRGLIRQITSTYPLLAPHMESIIPKKSQLDTVKLPESRATLYVLGSTPLFYQHMDDAIIPHLSLVHQYPDMFPRMRVDRGAIRFVLSGAALMVPGFTSPGGRLPRDGYAPPAKGGPDASGKKEGGAAEEGDDEDGEDGNAGDGEVKLANGGIAGVPSGAGKPTGDDSRYLDQPELEAGTVVIVEAEGKDHACAIGPLKMGTKEMKSAKKGIGIEASHYLGDGLWRLKID